MLVNGCLLARTAEGHENGQRLSRCAPACRFRVHPYEAFLGM
jgi:hypothetical protein